MGNVPAMKKPVTLHNIILVKNENEGIWLMDVESYYFFGNDEP